VTGEPAEALERLAGSTAPFVIGVRHHSPAVASIVVRALDAFDPTHVLVELPAELEAWLPWVGHDDAIAPLALAASIRGEASGLAFYPFADFSPELVAIRWGTRHGVRVEAIDLPVAERAGGPGGVDGEASDAPGLLDSMVARHEADGFEELWDRLVEARAEGQTPEAIRRAALLLGWTLRFDAVRAGGVSAHDARRESYMRSRVLAATSQPRARVAAVVGAFHASALVSPAVLGDVAPFEREHPAPEKPASVTTALLPYSFPLLDSRSGYPAGIRDPAWQQRVVEALAASRPLQGEAFEVVTDVARRIRASRHVAALPDACEAARVAIDLARVRGLTAPSRRELLEGIAAALGQGETLGRGRVIARALSKTLVGERRGVLAAGTPRSGLGPHVHALFGELGLPGPAAEEKEIVLDPERSALDRRREVALERLAAASVSYATRAPRGRTVASVDALTSRWTLKWTPATDATIEIAGLFGITLADAARGSLRDARARAEDVDGRAAPADLELVGRAARAGLGSLVVEGFDRLVERGLADAKLAEIVAAVELVLRIRSGHVPGLPLSADDAVAEAEVFAADLSLAESSLVEALLRGLDGLAGSDDIDDAMALRELCDLPERAGLGSARVAHAIDALGGSGAPLMQGAASALAFLQGRLEERAFEGRVSSFLVGAEDGGRDRARRVTGVLAVGMPALEDAPAFVRAVVETIASWTDDAFFVRLPSLRDGFEALAPRARDRLLATLVSAIDPADASRDLGELDVDPVRLAALAEADGAAHRVLDALGLVPPEAPAAVAPSPEDRAVSRLRSEANGALGTRDRLRLVLGRERDALPPHARRAAVALERLYGRGEGEGSNDAGAGAESAFPSARAWSDEIVALFGERVREEVVGRAAERGDGAAALELEPDRVRPSVELLEQILSLRGGLSEGDVAKLRRLASRIVDALVAELSTRVRPALAGLVSPRTSRRPSGPLDLGRTIGKNLKTARRTGDGYAVTPERLVFRTRQKRSLDWHVVLVVDVSGSMEPSVIYSALMAAVLSAMPALTVHFIAFNDRVVDLSDHAADPLTLLLEIAVGGGTLIGNALSYARSLVKVPRRTLALVVSDFEDGGRSSLLLGEVRALVESGVRLLGLAALDDRGAPRYEAAIASSLVQAGMPVAALSPLEVAAWIGEQIR
jgi:hypothetical protein